MQVDGVGGTAAVLGDDELGQAADVVALGILAGAAPDSRRSLSCGRLPSLSSAARVSTLRLSCDRAMMGMSSSLASCLSEREMVLTSCSRLPNFMPVAFMSCR